MRVTETNQEEVRNWIKLRLARNLDTFGAVRLLKAFGSAEAVLEGALADLARIVGMPAAEGGVAAARGAADDDADAAVERLRSTPEAGVLTIADSLCIPQASSKAERRRFCCLREEASRSYCGRQSQSADRLLRTTKVCGMLSSSERLFLRQA